MKNREHSLQISWQFFEKILLFKYTFHKKTRLRHNEWRSLKFTRAFHTKQKSLSVALQSQHHSRPVQYWKKFKTRPEARADTVYCLRYSLWESVNIPDAERTFISQHLCEENLSLYFQLTSRTRGALRN